MMALRFVVGVLVLSLCGCASVEAEAARGANAQATQTTQVAPFLMFQDGNAEAAMKFYVSLFDGGRVIETVRYGPKNPGGIDGKVQIGTFEIAGQRVRCTDSPIKHAWTFTPGVSLFVDCESGAQQERLVAALAKGGKTLMPLDDYGFSKRFAFVEDRYGVSWQINLPRR